MMNILVGGNDSGKSNFLRALNLFFNGARGDDSAAIEAAKQADSH